MVGEGWEKEIWDRYRTEMRCMNEINNDTSVHINLSLGELQ